jgi:hypothetical protein
MVDECKIITACERFASNARYHEKMNTHEWNNVCHAIMMSHVSGLIYHDLLMKTIKASLHGSKQPTIPINSCFHSNYIDEFAFYDAIDLVTIVIRDLNMQQTCHCCVENAHCTYCHSPNGCAWCRCYQCEIKLRWNHVANDFQECICVVG